MLIDEEKEIKKEISTDEELNTAIDNSLAVLPLDLDAEESKIVHDIIEAPTQQELQAQFDLFNMAQNKKNALRIIKLNKLLDKVEDQAIERFEKRPDQVSNRELLDYMQVVSGQIDRSQKQIDSLKDKPMISIKHETTEVNLNMTPELDRDSKNRVLNAIANLLQQAQKPVIEEDNVIDLSENIEDSSKIINEDEENIVYNNSDTVNENTDPE